MPTITRDYNHADIAYLNGFNSDYGTELFVAPGTRWVIDFTGTALRAKLGNANVSLILDGVQLADLNGLAFDTTAKTIVTALSDVPHRLIIQANNNNVYVSKSACFEIDGAAPTTTYPTTFGKVYNIHETSQDYMRIDGGMFRETGRAITYRKGGSITFRSDCSAIYLHTDSNGPLSYVLYRNGVKVGNYTPVDGFLSTETRLVASGLDTSQVYKYELRSYGGVGQVNMSVVLVGGAGLATNVVIPARPYLLVEGDSIAGGNIPPDGFPIIAAELLDYSLSYYSAPADSISGGLKQVSQVTIATHIPDVIFLEGITNDYGQNAPLVDFIAAVPVMIQNYVDYYPDAEILLNSGFERSPTGVNSVGSTWVDYKAAYVTAVASYKSAHPAVNVRLVDTSAWVTLADMEDGVLHPSTAGHVKLGVKLANEIEPSGGGSGGGAGGLRGIIGSGIF